MTTLTGCTFYSNGTTGITMTSSTAYDHTATTPSGSFVRVEHKINTQGDISPQLYFKYVKSKLTPLETTKHQRQIEKLSKMIMNSDAIKQIGLSESLAKKLAVCVRELEAKACGINKSLPREVIEKYQHKTKDVDVIMCNLENYPRIIESEVHEKIKNIFDKGLFDKYEVLYLDNSNGDDEDSKPIKSNRDKIIEKDPICFGSYSYAPDKLYFILDWVDDHCDLTFDKLVDEVISDDENFNVDMIPVVSKKVVDGIIQSVIDKHNRLDMTNQSNYRELAEQEREEQITEEEIPIVEEMSSDTGSILERLKNWFNTIKF